MSPITKDQTQSEIYQRTTLFANWRRRMRLCSSHRSTSSSSGIRAIFGCVSGNCMTCMRGDPQCHPERALASVIPSGGGAERRRGRGIPRSRRQSVLSTLRRIRGVLRLGPRRASLRMTGDPSGFAWLRRDKSTRPSNGLAQDDREKRQRLINDSVSEPARGD